LCGMGVMSLIAMTLMPLACRPGRPPRAGTDAADVRIDLPEPYHDLVHDILDDDAGRVRVDFFGPLNPTLPALDQPSTLPARQSE